MIINEMSNNNMRLGIPKRILIGSALVLAASILTLAVILLTPAQAPAVPKITWTPEKISETISPGESKVVPVTFTSSENVTNVVVRVVPELGPFVQAQPTSFPKLIKGQKVNLSVTFSAGQNSPLGSFNGTIQLRDASSKSSKTFAKPLPVVLNIWQALKVPDLPYSLKYPPEWVANIPNNDSVEIIGQATPTIPTAPGDMGGICKVTAVSSENPDSLPLLDWLEQEEQRTGALPPLSSTPITINGLAGVKEIGEEIALTTTIYLPLDNKIYSFQLLCGDDALNVGEIIFYSILNSLAFK